MSGPFALALAAGMAATVNPCGFAMLPAYLSAFVGLDQRGGRLDAVRRALLVSLTLTAGFVVVFGLFGLVITPFALRLEEHLPWATIVIGFGLVGLGVALLAGKQLLVKIPKLERGGSDGTLPSMFVFGVSYAIASLSCTIGPFLAVTTSTFRTESWFSGFGVFVMYAVGMGVVIALLTVSVALARSSLVGRFRDLVPRMNRIAGGLLVIAGAYVAYYGWYEIRVFRGDTGDPIVERATRVQTWLVNLIVPDEPVRFVFGAITLAIVAAVVVAVLRRRRRDAAVTDARTTQTTDVHERRVSVDSHDTIDHGSPT